jgi:hypothetical protein
MTTLLRFSPLALLLGLGLLPAACASDPGRDADADPAAADAEAESDLTASAADCAATKNADGWCWATPNHPVGASESLLAFGDNDAWTLASGVLVKWDGTRWKPLKSSVRVSAIWGTSSSDLWAIDEGAVYRRVNGDWSKVTDALSPRRLNAIWGSGPNDVWVVGGTSFVMHWNGTAWSISQNGNPSNSSAGYVAVDGTGPNDVWAVGTGPTGLPDSQVHHWDGAAWTSVPSSVVDSIGLRVVRAFAPNDVWVGGTTLLFHFDGTTWSKRIPPGFRDGPSGRGGSWEVTAISGTAGDVWVGTIASPNGEKSSLFRYSGNAYSEVSLPEIEDRYQPRVDALARTPSGKMLVARGSGDLWRTDGSTRTRLTVGPQIDFRQASASGRTVVASGLAGAIATRQGGAWVSKPIAGAGLLPSVAAFPGAVIASGTDQVARLSGAQASLLPLSGPRGDLKVAGRTADDLWVASYQGVWHLAGGQWTQLPHPMGRIYALAVAPDGAPVVSTEFAISRFDGAFWQKLQDASPRVMVYALDGALWTTAGDGVRKNGQPQALAKEVAEGFRYVTSMAACPDGRLYAVGSYGVLRAFEGGVWKTQEGGAPGLMPAAACTSDNVAWLFGDDGAIVRKDKP